MINYLINSFKRKKARRITRKYPTTIHEFDIPGKGIIQFANWDNPLVKRKEISAENIGFFEKFLKEGDTAIDIGANIGAMTIPIALAVGKKGTTISFDPNPYVFEILKQNVSLNPELTNIHPYNFAISENDGDFYYNSSEASFNNGGISTEKQNRHGKFALEKKIKGIKLEKFLEAEYPQLLGKIELIKIDTEGYDKEIIKSIGDFLIKYKPTVISECFGKTDAAGRFELYELLTSKGYSLYYFSDFIADAEIVPIVKKEDMLRWKHFDLFAKV